MPRGDSPTSRLAYIFVTEIRGETWNYQMGMRWLGDAKKLINPLPEKGTPLDFDMVVGTLRALKNGWWDFDGKFASMWVVTYGNPPYYQRYCEWFNNPPPAYNKAEVMKWESITGKKAYPSDEITSIIEVVPPLPKVTPRSDFWTENCE